MTWQWGVVRQPQVRTRVEYTTSTQQCTDVQRVMEHMRCDSTVLDVKLLGNPSTG